MGYVNFGVADAPQDPHAMIWRYMDFTKFVSTLETSALYFARADKLGDPWEGYLNDLAIKTYREMFAHRHRSKKKLEERVERHKSHRSWMTRNTAVNCWHMNNYESAA